MEVRSEKLNCSWFIIQTFCSVRIYVQGEEKLPALDLKGVQLEGNDMSGRFTLSHIDLHWSRTEHCVDGLRGDLEMQLNHFDLSFEDYDEASKIPGATIALGLLLEVQLALHAELNLFKKLTKKKILRYTQMRRICVKQ